nr:hypothetical protein [Tanacetum cinerariifolium]
MKTAPPSSSLAGTIYGNRSHGLMLGNGEGVLGSRDLAEKWAGKLAGTGEQC